MILYLATIFLTNCATPTHTA